MELTGTNRPKAYFFKGCCVVFAFTVWFLGSSPFFWVVFGRFWGHGCGSGASLFLFNLCVVLGVLWWCPLFLCVWLGCVFLVCG